MGLETVAAIGAAGTVGGAAVQGYYANKAAQAQGKAYGNAADELRDSRATATGYLTPYRDVGESALGQLSGLVTGQQYDPNTGQINSISDQQRGDLFKKSPGYQFRLDQAQLALSKSQAAKGNLLSGGAVKEAGDRAQGIASDEYGNYLNQLSSLAMMGQNAATSSGGFAAGLAAPIANMTANQGLSQANYYGQLGNIIGGGLSQIGGLAGLAGGSGGGGGGGSAAGAGSGPFMNAGSNMMAPSTSLQYQAPTGVF